MENSEIAPLQVANEQFIVASMIERCPKTMMLRELMKNAIEAAEHAPDGHRSVEFSAVPIEGVPKLVVWNTGPGMDASELLKICNIAASVRKEMSLTGNFGMGAKVASLPSNQIGMRYRSCKNGVVHEVLLGKRNDTYGRIRRRDPDTGEFHEVIDVTAIVQDEGRDCRSDWTEVMLLGNRLEQDTVRDPYNGDPLQEAQWIATYLYHRFYRLPDGVQVVLKKGTNKLDGNRIFETIPSRERYFERCETIHVAGGLKIHYRYDAPYENQKGSGHNKSISGAIASAVSTCAVVFRDEMYDLHRGRKWSFDAPIFGIPFGAKHISIHIELPSEFNVIPEAYRQFLQYTAGEQSRVQASDFADFVRENRPDWLIEVIRSFAPDNSSNDEIRDELQKLLNNLRVRRVSPKTSTDGRLNIEDGIGPGADVSKRNGTSNGQNEGQRRRPADLSMIPSGARRAELFKNLERAPEIIPLFDELEIEEKELKGRAARYYMETNQIFINMQYPSIEEMKLQLETEYAGASDLDAMRSLALTHAQRTIVLRVGRTVVYALAKQLNKEWNQKAVEIASSPESLSMAADDFTSDMQNARRAIGKALRTSRQSDADVTVV